MTAKGPICDNWLNQSVVPDVRRAAVESGVACALARRYYAEAGLLLGSAMVAKDAVRLSQAFHPAPQ